MRWKFLIGVYDVSEDGQIRNWRTGLVRKPKRLPPWGYLQVSLSVGGKPVYYYVHRAVLEAFVGPCPDGMQARHLDGDRENNHVRNLAWGTPKENSADTERHGRIARGSRLPHSKLTPQQIEEIRDASGFHKEIAAQYGVCRQRVSQIKSGVIARA